MLYHDKVYGAADIEEPILLDLVSSKAIQRLKGVLQHGVSALIGITRKTTRFEHSLGVMLLVQKLGATLEEQIAALLHDVSHTAFSHVIDYVFNSHVSQRYHEEHKLAYVSKTDIPEILEGYSYDWVDFMEEENFPLLEQDLPHLCADRLDYFFRDARDLGLAEDADTFTALKYLINHGGKVVVNDLETARWLGYRFIECDKASWANFREVGLYELAARAIRRGLAIGVLTEEDIWGKDQPAWEKLRASKDPKLQHDFQRIHPETRFIWDDTNPEFCVATKLRSIDPDVLIDTGISPLSKVDPDFAFHRNAYLAQNSGKWAMRAIVGD